MSPASSPLAKDGPRAIVLGCASLALSSVEAGFFRDFDPLGFILFARNCESPGQVRELVAALRACVGRADAPVLIDQEGGRVARLKPPHWPVFPAMRVFGEMAAKDQDAAVRACRMNAALIGYELASLGIDMDCLPVLDVPSSNGHDVIGNRAFSPDPELVAALGAAVCEGLAEAGVGAIIKHVPGHGRATADSHHELPRVTAGIEELRATDFPPFRALRNAGWAMVAHVLYTALDPERPATTSAKVITETLRGEIGFEGFLIADDIGMQALDGSLAERAEATLAAGNDLTLHCSGRMEEMEALAGAVRTIDDAQPGGWRGQR